MPRDQARRASTPNRKGAGLHNTVLWRTAIVTPGEVSAPDATVLNSLDRPPWIDENSNPNTGDGTARALLSTSVSLVERSKNARFLLLIE
jgi:hypothetical protein